MIGAAHSPAANQPSRTLPTAAGDGEPWWLHQHSDIPVQNKSDMDSGNVAKILTYYVYKVHGNMLFPRYYQD